MTDTACTGRQSGVGLALAQSLCVFAHLSVHFFRVWPTLIVGMPGHRIIWDSYQMLPVDQGCGTEALNVLRDALGNVWIEATRCGLVHAIRKKSMHVVVGAPPAR